MIFELFGFCSEWLQLVFLDFCFFFYLVFNLGR